MRVDIDIFILNVQSRQLLLESKVYSVPRSGSPRIPSTW